MPIQHRVDAPNRMVWSRASGRVTGDELHRAQLELVDHPDFRPDFSQLCDLREISEAAVETGALEELAARNPFGAGSRRALVVSRNVFYGLARMWEAMRADGGDVVEVFRSMDGARAWLEGRADGAVDEAGGENEAGEPPGNRDGSEAGEEPGAGG